MNKAVFTTESGEQGIAQNNALACSSLSVVNKALFTAFMFTAVNGGHCSPLFSGEQGIVQNNALFTAFSGEQCRVHRFQW